MKCQHLEMRMGACLGKTQSFRKWSKEKERESSVTRWQQSWSPFTWELVVRLGHSWRERRWPTAALSAQPPLPPAWSCLPLRSGLQSLFMHAPTQENGRQFSNVLRPCAPRRGWASEPFPLAIPRWGDWCQDSLPSGTSRCFKRCSLSTIFFGSRVEGTKAASPGLLTLMTSFWITIIFLTLDSEVNEGLGGMTCVSFRSSHRTCPVALL